MNLGNGRIALLDSAVVLDAEMLEYSAGPKCGECVHWRKQPQARDKSGVPDLSQPTVGECRYQLCSVPVMANGPHGPILQGFMSAYAGSLPPDWPACGRGFTPKVPVEGQHGD